MGSSWQPAGEERAFSPVYSPSTSTVVTRCARARVGKRKRREGQKEGCKVGGSSDSCRIGNVDSPPPLSTPFPPSPRSLIRDAEKQVFLGECALCASLLFLPLPTCLCTTLCEFHPLSRPLLVALMAPPFPLLMSHPCGWYCPIRRRGVRLCLSFSTVNVPWCSRNDQARHQPNLWRPRAICRVDRAVSVNDL